MKVDESFSPIITRTKAAKPEIMKRQLALLEQCYDLHNHGAQGVTMSRGKAIQDGVRLKLPNGVNWQSLNEMTPDEIRSKDRFFTPRMINTAMASADGPITTFPLRGVKDSPPYLHDGRLLTLEDTVEFFNLISSTKLTQAEKAAWSRF